MLRILVVEDDQKLCRVVCNHLNSHGYEATGCRNAQDAYDQMYHRPYALIVSDIMMPGIDGFEFAAAVRRIDREISILFMTARDDYGSKEKSYQAGIDDYMVKPIDLNELVLRIGALLRRANIASENKLTVGSFVMNADDKTAVCNGEEIALTAREFNTLFKLLSYPKRIFTRAQLMEEFWDVDTEATLRSVDVYIAKLRDKLSVCEDFQLVTVRGDAHGGFVVGTEALLSQAVRGVDLPVFVAFPGLVQHGAALFIERGDAAEQVPQAFHIRLQLPLAPGDIAGLRCSGTIHRAAELRELVIHGDVPAGHLGIPHQERRRGQSRDAAAHDIGISFLDARLACGGGHGHNFS